LITVSHKLEKPSEVTMQACKMVSGVGMSCLITLLLVMCSCTTKGWVSLRSNRETGEMGRRQHGQRLQKWQISAMV